MFLPGCLVDAMSARQISFAAAPVFLFIYGICYLLDGQQGFHGPGIFWTAGHVFFVLAFFAFAFATWELRRQAGDGTMGHVAVIAAFLTIAGIAVFVRVGGIDLATGALAPNHDAMASISKQLNEWPDARLLPWWRVGPILFQAGLMSLLILLAFVKRLPWWSPIAVALGFVVIAYSLNLLVGGAVLIGIGFFPLIRPKQSTAL
jgi:hypothetical protein